MEVDLWVGRGWVPNTLDMCSGKTNPSRKGAIHMVPRPKLGSDSIYTLSLVHSRLRRTSYKETITTCCP